MSTNVMGPLPAAPHCLCQICLPRSAGFDTADDPVEAAAESSCVDTVLRVGWQVMLVGGGGDCTCGEVDDEVHDEVSGACDPDDAAAPAFAYTVGLSHRAGHPELAISGLPVSLMHSVLNYVAERVVRDGHRVRVGDTIEGALANVALTVDRVSDVGYRDIGTWSAWFHRAPVEALQLVWPTPAGLFGWQPGAPSELELSQPSAWRLPTPRVGAFAADPPWPLPVAPDALAFLCTHVRGRGEPIRFVARQRGVSGGEDWTFHCGREHGPGIDDMTTEHVAHTVRSAPSVRELADLRLDEMAWRDDAFSPWQRGPAIG